MHEAHHELHSELEDPNDAEGILQFLERRLLEAYFNPPVEGLLDFLAAVGKEHFDQELAEVTDPPNRADIEDEGKDWETNVRVYREGLAKAEGESGEDWRRRFAVRREIFAALLDRVLLFQVLPRIESCRAYSAAWEASLSVSVGCGSADEAREAWQKAHDVEFERIKLRHGNLLCSRIGNLFPLA
jgi:hypothetical protein